MYFEKFSMIPALVLNDQMTADDVDGWDSLSAYKFDDSYRKAAWREVRHGGNFTPKRGWQERRKPVGVGGSEAKCVAMSFASLAVLSSATCYFQRFFSICPGSHGVRDCWPHVMRGFCIF